MKKFVCLNGGCNHSFFEADDSPSRIEFVAIHWCNQPEADGSCPRCESRIVYVPHQEYLGARYDDNWDESDYGLIADKTGVNYGK